MYISIQVAIYTFIENQEGDVENMENMKINNNFFKVRNQYLLENEKFIIFQSYETTMLVYSKNKNYISFNTNGYNYTNTTNKYLKQVIEYIYYMTNSDKLKDLLNSNNRKRDILALEKGVLKL